MGELKNFGIALGGCVIGLVVISVIISALPQKPGKHFEWPEIVNQSQQQITTISFPERKIATLDGYEDNANYERIIADLLSRLAAKHDTTSEIIASEANVTQDMLRSDGITESLREILEAVDYSVPSKIKGLKAEEVFAAYRVLRSGK